MQWATLGNSGSESALQLQGRIARAFSITSLVNTMNITAAILTAARSLGSHYYKKSQMTILGLAVLFIIYFSSSKHLQCRTPSPGRVLR